MEGDITDSQVSSSQVDMSQALNVDYSDSISQMGKSTVSKRQFDYLHQRMRAERAKRKQMERKLEQLVQMGHKISTQLDEKHASNRSSSRLKGIDGLESRRKLIKHHETPRSSLVRP